MRALVDTSVYFGWGQCLTSVVGSCTPAVLKAVAGSSTVHVDLSGVLSMQLHSGAEHFGKVIYRGIITRGCS
jgi:hypothetical protein